MPLNVNQLQQNKKDDVLDKIAKGVNIASTVYGLYSDYNKLQNQNEATKIALAEEKRKAEGILTPKEQLESSDRYNVSKTPTEGSFALKNTAGETSYYSPRAPKVDTAGQFTDKEVADFVGKGGRVLDAALVPPGQKGVTFVNRVVDGKPVKVALVPPPKTEPSGTEKKPTADQFKAATFGRRAEQAEEAFARLESEGGYNRATLGQSAAAKFAPEGLKSRFLKQQEQAEKNFLNAILRRESGAVISAEEFANGAAQYFPRAGDTPEVLAQKAANRAQALAGLKAESGNAWAQVPAVKYPAGTFAKDRSAGDLISEAQAGQKQAKFSADDLKALEWARNNPNDPKAKQIVQVLKAKGL